MQLHDCISILDIVENQEKTNKMQLKKIELSKPLDILEKAKFPRPDLIRSPSYSLDGEWSLCPDRGGLGVLKKWYDPDVARTILEADHPGGRDVFTITVPFPLEAEINQRALAPRGYDPEKIAKTRCFWYFKRFKRPDNLTTGIIRFGAIDHKATVWLNGTFLGVHQGGYTPFSFEVHFTEEDNVLALMVEDSLSMSQVRGKQTFLKKPFIVWYVGCTGIWQSVWIEPTGDLYIENINAKRHASELLVNISIKTRNQTFLSDVSLQITVFNAQVHTKKRPSKKPIASIHEALNLDAFGKSVVEIAIPLKTFMSWSPEWPAVHPIELMLKKGKQSLDIIQILFGHRTIETETGKIKLNGKKIYQKLLLNQGYYPSGHYTPESPEQFRKDIQLMKDAGFNGCRMHQKIESPHLLYWADILGFLIWEEMPSYYRPSRRNLKNLEKQFEEVMNRDSLHPSIVTLVLFNESWGLSWGFYNIFFAKRAREDLAELYSRIKERYPGYLVIDNSGFHHVKTDIADIHHYIGTFQETEEFYDLLSKGIREAPLLVNYIKLLLGKENVQTPFIHGYGERESPLIISEFGGYGFSYYEHEELSLEDFLRKHLTLLHAFPKIQGYCYTQFTDVYDEKNGLFTFERIPKITSIKDIISKQK